MVCKNLDILSFGELLADVSIHADKTPTSILAGGAPANLAVAACKLGARVAFAGKVGADPEGDMLVDTLSSYGVLTCGVVRARQARTTRALATYDERGDANYSFDRSPGADQLVRIEEVPGDLVSSAKIVHVGSLALTHDPSRSCALRLAGDARRAGALVSFDVNWRPFAWDDVPQGLEVTRGMVGTSQLVKMNVEEGALLFGEPDPCGIARAVLARGARLVAVTLGQAGAFLATEDSSALVEAPVPDHVADTVGAGDTFWGAVLAWLAGRGVVEGLAGPDLAECGRFACTAATLSVQRRGGMASSPNRAEVLRAL